MINIVCVNRADLVRKIELSNFTKGILPNPFSLFTLPVVMKLYKWLVQEDDSKLQVIPFITLINRETREVLIYRPIDVSMPCSIGIDTYMEEVNSNQSLDEMVSRQAADLLHTELGIKDHQLHQRAFMKNITEGNCGILYDDRERHLSNSVAVSLIAFIKPEDITLSKPNVFTRGQWMEVSDIVKALESKLFTLNAWSLSVLEVLKTAL